MKIPPLLILLFGGAMLILGICVVLQPGFEEEDPDGFRDACQSPESGLLLNLHDAISFNDPSARDEREFILPDDRSRCWVKGRVTGPEGVPIPGAEVKLRLAFERGQEIWSALTHAGEDGSYSAVLDGLIGLTPAARSMIQLSGMAFAPLHHQSKWSVAELPAAGCGCGETCLDLVLEPSAVLKGRVTCSDGRPCEGTSVYLSFNEIGWLMKRTADAEGCYRIPILYRGPHQLAAVHDGRGLSRVMELHLDPNKDRTAPDLKLHGSGVIEGVAVYPDGKPAGGITLEAKSTRHDDSVWRSRKYHPLSDEYAGLNGLPKGATKTGLDGRFRFTGLEPGSYSIECRKSGDRSESERPCYPTGERQAKIKVTFYRVRLRVVDEEGGGVPGSKYSFSFYRGEDLEASGSGTVRTLDGLAYISGEFLAPSPGARLKIEAWTPYANPAEACVEIQEGVYEPHVDLVLDHPKNPCVLKLKVQGPTEEPLPEFEGHLWKRGQPSRRIEFRNVDRSGVRFFNLSPGRYGVLVRSGGSGCHDYFHAVEEFEAVGGEEKEVILKLPPAGRLRLTVHPPPGYKFKGFLLQELHLEPVDEEARAYTAELNRDLIGFPILNAMKVHCRMSSSRDKPYTFPHTPEFPKGEYRLYAKFLGCLPLEQMVIVEWKKTKDVNLRPVFDGN